MPNKDKKTFSIQASVDEVLRIIGMSITNQEITVETNIPHDAYIVGYKSEYEQVVLNLLSNAKMPFLLRENTVVKLPLA